MESGLMGAHCSIHITHYQYLQSAKYSSTTECLVMILDNSRSRLETYPGLPCIHLDRVLNPPLPHLHLAWR